MVSYWKPSTFVSDNRIPALSVAFSSYSFLLPEGTGEVQVTAELRYRHLIAELMDQKDWDVPDDITATVSSNQSYIPQWVIFTPLVKNRQQPPSHKVRSNGFNLLEPQECATISYIDQPVTAVSRKEEHAAPSFFSSGRGEIPRLYDTYSA